jgi:hypothetical protein
MAFLLRSYPYSGLTVFVSDWFEDFLRKSSLPQPSDEGLGFIRPGGGEELRSSSSTCGRLSDPDEENPQRPKRKFFFQPG